MEVDSSKGINIAFQPWLENYCENLVINDIESIVLLMSIENIEMSESWRQQFYNKQYPKSYWNSPSYFYSLTNSDVIEYMQLVANDCLKSINNKNNNGLKGILQIAEAGWWCQALDGADGVLENQTLAIYDNSTQEKFLQEFGYQIPNNNEVIQKIEIAQ